MSAMLSEIILGALGDAAIQYAGSKGFAWLKSRDSKEELAAIAAASLEAVIPGVPALAEDLRSESFAKGVVVPMLEALVADPSQLPDPERLADQYIRMFVERFAGGSSADDTLKRIFQTEPSELKPAFIIFFSAFRSRLYQSKHWRELGHFAATEATFKNTEAIKSVLEGMAQPDEMTKELILHVAENVEVLGASLTGKFADGLQSLLLYPGFDEPVMQVTERVAALIIDKKGGKSRGFIDKDFVQVAIALQRNDGPLRARAMDVYEKLLDAGAYGAEEAAKDVLGR